MSRRMLSRHEFLHLGGLAIAASVLAACAPAAPSAPTAAPTSAAASATTAPASTPAAAKENVTLTYMGYNDPGFTNTTKQMATKFHELFPNITVNFQLSEYRPEREKAAAMAAAGNPPDIAMGDFDEIIPTGVLLDCNPYIKQGGKFAFSWDQCFKFAADKGRRALKNATSDPNGGSYLFPFESLGAAVFYNKTLFDEASLPYPKDDWTWDDLAALAPKLTKDGKGNRPGQSGFDPSNVSVYGTSHLNWWYIYLGIARAEGTDILKPDYSTSAMHDPGWLTVFNWVDDLVNKYHSHPGGVMTNTGAVGTVAFKSGTIAMDPGMSWNVTSYVKDIKAFDWSMAPIPTWKGKRIPIGVCDTQCIFKGSKYHDDSWNFMSWYESDTVSQDYLSGIEIPPNKSVAESDAFWKPWEKYNPKALQIGLDQGLGPQYDRAYGEWNGFPDQAIGAFNSREKFKTAQEALDWAAQQIDQARAKVWAS